MRKIFSQINVLKKIIRRWPLGICMLVLTLSLSGCGKSSYLQEMGSTSSASVSAVDQKEASGNKQSDHSSKSSAKTDQNDKTSSKKSKKTESGIDTELEEAENSAETADNDGIYVQVAGAVTNPGVFHLKKDARVFEAIAMAGGMTEAADMNSLNQAAMLSDGQLVYVCRQGETPSENVSALLGSQSGTGASQSGTPSAAGNSRSNTSGTGNGLVNINTADVSQLTTLPGIGETRAEAIIAYRQKNGAFSSCEDIMKVSGIKQGAYAKIQDLICVR